MTPSNKLVSALGAVCAALSLVPILLAAVPPLLDYPSHIARIFIIHDLLFHGRFAEMYALRPAILPNLGMDIVLLGAMVANIDIEFAGRLLLAVLVLGLGSSVMLVHRRLFGRWSVFPLLAFAFIYNKILMLGFINYLLGVCIALFGFAFWLHVRDRGAPVRSALILIGWSVAAFLCHLMAAILLLGLIGAHEAAWTVYDLARRRFVSAARDVGRTVVLLPSLAVAAGLYMVTPFSERAGSTSLQWGLADIAFWFKHRADALLHAADSYDPTLGYVVVGGIILLLLGCLLAGYLRISWSMLPALAAIVLANFVVPYHWNGTSFIADRVPILLVLLGIASLDIVLPERGHARTCLALLILLLVGAQSVSASLIWRNADRNYGSMRAVLDQLPEGTRIYGAVIYKFNFHGTLRQPWVHFPSFAVLRNRIRVAGIFADPSQNILVRAPAMEALAALHPRFLRVDFLTGKPDFEYDVFTPERLSRFDYVLVANPALYPGGIPPNLVPLHTAGEATLFEISHATR